MAAARMPHHDIAAWYATHFDRLVVLAARLLDDADEAEDVAQETLIKAYLAVGEGSRITCLDAWLTRVARNLAVSRLRRRREHVRRCARLEAAALPAGLVAESDPAAAG